MHSAARIEAAAETARRIAADIYSAACTAIALGNWHDGNGFVDEDIVIDT